MSLFFEYFPCILKMNMLICDGYVKSIDWAVGYWQHDESESGMVEAACVQYRAFSHEPPLEISVERAGWFRYKLRA